MLPSQALEGKDELIETVWEESKHSQNIDEVLHPLVLGICASAGSKPQPLWFGLVVKV